MSFDTNAAHFSSLHLPWLHGVKYEATCSCTEFCSYFHFQPALAFSPVFHENFTHFYPADGIDKMQFVKTEKKPVRYGK